MSTTHANYVQRLLARFDADPDRAALVSRGTLLTAGELADATRRAAAAMARHGIGRADVVRILTERNAAPTLILQWAANLVGATAAHVRWVNPAGPDHDLRSELRRAVGARMLAVDPDNAGRARELMRESADRPILAVLGAGVPDAVDLTAGSGDGAGPWADVADDDLAMITQTRLPNGARHGVCWTFGVMNDMDSAAPSPSPGGATPAGPDTAGGGDRMVVLITAPLIHADGFNVEDVLVCGGMVVLHDGFDAGAVLRAVAEYRISRLILGTPQVYALAEHPNLADTDLSSVTELFYRGTTAVPRRLREARELFTPLLTQVYGTTEAGILAMLGPDEHGCVDGYGTVGRPLDPEGLSIRHPETGVALHAGEVGEICAKPRRPSAGYWLAPEPTAALVRGGWVRTGDSGRLDAGGYLHVNGRIADMVTVNGVRIHPEAVEQVLGLAPGVSQAGVCGIEDADGVERVYAVVVTESGAVVDLQELRRRVAEALSEEHVPSLIEIHRALPVTGWGKPDRVRLRGDARRRRPTEIAIATTA